MEEDLYYWWQLALDFNPLVKASKMKKMIQKSKFIQVFFSSFLLFGCAQKITKQPKVNKNTSKYNEITIAVGGDWSDAWGENGATERSLQLGAKHDVILMAGDLSYAGKDGDFKNNIQNAKNWAANVNNIVADTPVLFVAGDHDSKNQDGDILTYAKHLNYPDGSNGIMPPTGKLKGYDYEGMYPYLWFNDIINGDVKVRIVGTTNGFQETEHEEKHLQKYLKHTYTIGSENYKWIEAVYADAQQKGYWILHLNHLPWIDMGKNQSFVNSQGLIDLASKYGVNVLMTGSSHNIWRTKPLKINEKCTSIALTTKPNGANSACVGNVDNHNYKKEDGLIQTHVGVAGKTSAISLKKYPDACNPKADGEVKYYVAENTCVTKAITGIVSLKITKEKLSGEFIKIDGSVFEPYSFIVKK